MQALQPLYQSDQQVGFKTCSLCAHRWETVSDLIRDDNLIVNGYQPSFSKNREGLFLLTHVVEGCGTTIALQAGSLLQLYGGSKVSKQSVAYTGHCSGNCQIYGEMVECSSHCPMRWAHDIIEILKSHRPEAFLSTATESKPSRAVPSLTAR